MYGYNNLYWLSMVVATSFSDISSSDSSGGSKGSTKSKKHTVPLKVRVSFLVCCHQFSLS